MKELLENPTQTVNDMSYFNCLDSVMENSKVGVFLRVTDTRLAGHGEP